MQSNSTQHLIRLLNAPRHEAPSRRFRGKRRHFRRVARRAGAFRISPEPGHWWDLWHYHADWAGWGNRRWRYRRQHLDCLALVYRRIAASSSSFLTPFQAWIYLSGRDAGEDATYLHTPNGNGTEFPFLPRDVQWGDALAEQYFNTLLPDRRFRVGVSTLFDPYAEPPRVTRSIFAYSPTIGVPLE